MNRAIFFVCVAVLALSPSVSGEEPAAPGNRPAVVTLPAERVEAMPGKASQATADALDKTIIDLAPGIELQKVFADLSVAAKVNVIVNWNALEEAGMSRSSTHRIHAAQVSARDALRDILATAAPNAILTFVVQDNQVLISSRDDLRRRFQVTRVYDLGFLLNDLEPGSNKSVAAEAELLDVIRESIEPDSWTFSGGSEPATIVQDKLIIRQSYDVAPRIDALMDLLCTRPAISITAYDVHDLLRNAPPPDAMGHGKLEDLVNAIETTCGRDTWRDKGGKTSSIAAFDGKLLVTTTPAVHQQIADLLAMMRQKD